MINLRYHIVSLIAVFLALALGVVAGTTVVNQSLVNQLRTERNHDRTALLAERTLTASQKEQLSVWSTYGEAAISPLIRDRLRGKKVVLLASAGSADTFVSDVSRSLTDAGATIAGRVDLSDRWALRDQASIDQLGTATRSFGANDPSSLLNGGATLLATRLRAPIPDPANDLLRALDRAGFLKLSGTTAAAFPSRDVAFVYCTADLDKPVPSQAGFALPFIRTLAASRTVAVAESLSAVESLTDRVTGDADLAARVVTVDDGDTLVGRYGLVVGLQESIAGRPALHYGVRAHTLGVAPTPSPAHT